MKINTVHGNVIVTEVEKQRNELPQNVEFLTSENADLMLQNAIQDMTIETMQNENAEMFFRLATLEMGGI